MSNVRESYSPSETRTWLICPRMRYLGARWEPAGDSLASRTLGRAVGEGLDAYYRALAQGIGPDPAEAQALLMGTQVLHVQWDDSETKWTREGAAATMLKSLRVALGTDLLRGGVVQGVQVDLGGAIVDLMVRRDGGLHVIDHKWSETRKPEWVQYDLARQDVDIQLWQYAAMVEEALGEPAKSVGFHLVGSMPRPRAWYEPLTVDPDHLAIFRGDLHQWWAHMGVEDAALAADPTQVPAGRWTACLSKDENYGRCRFYGACHFPAYRRPERMAGFYTQKGAR
jgi:hypothetical protein